MSQIVFYLCLHGLVQTKMTTSPDRCTKAFVSLVVAGATEGGYVCFLFRFTKKAELGFLKGKNQRSCRIDIRLQIIGGIRASTIINKSKYPVLLPLKWTVIHKRCGHGTPLVRPTRSANK